MKIKDVIATLEVFAPLPLQDEYDNAGLQVGLTDADISGVLLCLDVTEEVLAEAVGKGCNMVVAHHPLLFHPLRRLSDATYVERCVRYAVANNLTIYAAHTNLDNAYGGVNFDLASRLGLEGVEVLRKTHADPPIPLKRGDSGARNMAPPFKGVGGISGSGAGAIGTLPHPMAAREFVGMVKEVLGAECAMCNELLERPISRVALCGGAGDFLLGDAVSKGADAFITGEMHYHQYFGHEQEIQIVVCGHYETEHHVPALLQRIIREAHPTLPTHIASRGKNPINIIAYGS